MYLHERDNWWRFTWDYATITPLLGRVRAHQGAIMGRMSAVGFDFQQEAMLSSMTNELVRSSEIEGELLNLQEVRSSIARRLGIDTVGHLPNSSRYIDGVVEMLLDATQHYDQPLTAERLYGWHNVLFPTGRSRLYQIEVGRYRSGEMQVVSGAMGHERVHYQAPGPERVAIEMERFLQWANSSATDAVLMAGIAHLWFVSIHPFDDGNGRIARAITEMMLARSDNSRRRYYSMSVEIKRLQKEYYSVLERTQHGRGDITEWLTWFLHCLDAALTATDQTMASIMAKNAFWERNRGIEVNMRQQRLINMLFDGFEGKLTTRKWAKIAKCSQDTALNDINDLIAKNILKKNPQSGRNTSYSLID